MNKKGVDKMLIEKRKLLKTEKVNFSKLKKVSLNHKNAENEDYFFLNDYLKENLYEKLEKHKVKHDNNLVLSYSLCYCQGDGLHFSGNVSFKGMDFNLVNTGPYNYCSEHDINYIKEDGNEKKERIYEEFKNIYLNICKELEEEGYQIIEETDKENILKQGFEDFKTLNNIQSDLDLFDLDYSDKKQKGFIQISKNSTTFFELWVKPFELKQLTERVLKSETKIIKYLK